MSVALVLGIRTWRADPEVTAIASQDDQLDTAMEAFSALASVAEAEAARPVYQYSVVPGGTYNRDELRSAIRHDAVVAAHYKNLDQSRLRSEVVPHDRYVHVSYRKGNDVFWTSKKVLLRKGETILTDGTTQVRARCGNCISEQPLAPTAANEPDVVEFDRLVADTPSSQAGEPSRIDPVFPVPPIVFSPEPFAVGPFAPGTGGSGAPVPPAPGAATSGGVRSPDPLASARPAGMHEPGSPDSRGPSSSGNNPWSDPPTDVPPGFPGDGITPLDIIDPFPPGPGDPGGPLDPPLIPPTEPFNPVPVPEPGTLLLVGGGVAALVRKFRSRGR